MLVRSVVRRTVAVAAPGGRRPRFRHLCDAAGRVGMAAGVARSGTAVLSGGDDNSSSERAHGSGAQSGAALEDLAEAAALFRPEWERTAGVDGYVSLEVPPDVAYDAAATIALARRLHEQAGFGNLLVKIPALRRA